MFKRNEIEEFIRRYCDRTVSKISRKVDYVVVANMKTGSSKLAKVNTADIRRISEGWNNRDKLERAMFVCRSQDTKSSSFISFHFSVEIVVPRHDQKCWSKNYRIFLQERKRRKED